MDLLEILHASAARDAETHDSNFSSFFWNISQNASKEKHRSACPGIAGCITPGGEFFLPHVGRPLLGCEKLLLQGIPYFRLALGNETEVQIGDLAGNAMSLTVVCATMLGAIMSQQLRKETLASKDKDLNKILKSSGFDQKERNSSIIPRLVFKHRENANSLFQDLAKLAKEAVKSSIWCTCETSGRNSLSEKFLQSKVSRVTVCRVCCGTTSGYHLDSEDTFEVHLTANEHNPGDFLKKLRDMAPPTLLFGKEGFKEILQVKSDKYRVHGLDKIPFNLHRIKRDSKKWLLIYYARENNGVGDAIAEFRITVGELSTQSVKHLLDEKEIELGMKGELKSFRPAKSPPFEYGPIEPCAVVKVEHKRMNSSVKWSFKALNSTTNLSVIGNGETDSMRKEVGILKLAEDILKENSKAGHNKKVFNAAAARGEARRWLYPTNWMKWPAEIIINSHDDTSLHPTLDGKYLRVACQHTVNQSALWIRHETMDNPALYLLMKPEVSRTGPDVAIISTSLSHEDANNIVAIFPQNWEPSDSLDSKHHNVKNVRIRNWSSLCMECLVPESSIQVHSPKSRESDLLTVHGLKDEDINMFTRCFDVDTITKFSNSNRVSLNVTRGQKAQQTVRVFNAICVAPILKYAAKNGLPYDMGPNGDWIDIAPKESCIPFGCCTKTIPPRPKQLWRINKERGIWERYTEAGASRKYYLALQDTPQTFEMWLNKSNNSVSIVVNPEVQCHHSAAPLIEGRGGKLSKEIKVQYRLADTLQQPDPILKPFKVRNCNEQKPTFVSLKNPFSLYERQQKAVTKMLAIENSLTEFEELEMSEQELPGSTGWSLIAKAVRKTKTRGGVIADCIGAGKTVVSIAIILCGLEASRASRCFPRKSSATLVVVPPGLIVSCFFYFLKFISF